MSEAVQVTAPPPAAPEAKVVPPAAPAPVATPPAQAPAVDPKVLQDQFAKLLVREKATLAERQKISAERREFDEARAKMAAELKEAAELRAWKNSAKTDAPGLLKGLFGDEWQHRVSETLVDKRTPVDLRVDASLEEIAKIRADLKSRDEAAAAERTKANEERQRETAERFQAQATAHVKSGGDKYKLVNALGYHDHVTDLIRHHWEQQTDIPEAERKLLSVDESAAMVEEWVRGQTKKAQDLLTPAATSATVPAKAPAGTSLETRTLSSALPGTSAAPVWKKRTEAERVRDAIAAGEAAEAAKKKKLGA